GTRIQFGETGRSVEVEESDSAPRLDESGNAFLVQAHKAFVQNWEKNSKSKREYKERREAKKLPYNSVWVKTYEGVTIPPHMVKLVKVKAKFKEGQSEGFMERVF